MPLSSAELNSLVNILIFGSLLFFAFLSLANPLRVNRKANFYFGLFNLLWSSFWFIEIIEIVAGHAPDEWFIMVIRMIQFFTPLFFYLSILFFTNPNYRFNGKDLRLLLLPGIFFIVLMADHFHAGDQVILPYNYLLIFLILIQSILFSGISYLRIHSHRRNVKLFASNTEEIDLKWLEYINLLILALSLLVSLYNLFFISQQLNLFINSVLLLVIYVVGYYSLRQKEIFPVNDAQRNTLIAIEEEQSGNEIKRKILSDEELEQMKQRLLRIMEQDRPYLESELNLLKLAEQSEITPHQLSYLINTGFGTNFFQFINRYRVERAVELLADEEKDHLSILGIAFESGFNSKTSFNTTFKKFKQITPSEFKHRRSIL